MSLDFSDNNTSDDEPPARAHSATLALSSSHNAQTWKTDSGCSLVMTPDDKMVIKHQSSQKVISLADASSIKATHYGLSVLPLDGLPSISSLLVPDLQDPLLLVAAVCNMGVTLVFTKSGCNFYKADKIHISKKPIGKGFRKGNLYYLLKEVRSPPLAAACPTLTADSSLLSWHHRLGHIGLKPLKAFLKASGITPSLSNEIDAQKCSVCVASKMTWVSFKSCGPHCSTAVG